MTSSHKLKQKTAYIASTLISKKHHFWSSQCIHNDAQYIDDSGLDIEYSEV